MRSSRSGAGDRAAALTFEERLNHDIFMHVLENEIAETGFRAYLMPMSKTSGFRPRVRRAAEYVLFDAEGLRELHRSSSAFKAYAEGHIELMRIGEGCYAPPRAVLEGAFPLRPRRRDAARSVFFRPLRSFRAIGRPRAAPSRQRAIAVDRAVTRPWQSSSTNTSRGQTRRRVVAPGRAFTSIVSATHDARCPPEEIHEIGLAEVKRIRAGMEEIIRKVGFQGSFVEFVTFLRTDDRFVGSPEALMKEVALC
jgi:uncharacterized protein (DUF885 family)